MESSRGGGGGRACWLLKYSQQKKGTLGGLSFGILNFCRMLNIHNRLLHDHEDHRTILQLNGSHVLPHGHPRFALCGV